MISETVPAAMDGERLDRLVALVLDCSRTKAATLISEGLVRLDGAVLTTRSVRVETGSAVEIDAEPYAPPEAVEAEADVDVTIAYIDDHVIVVNKPAGLVVHPGAGNPTGTLVQGLLARYPEIADVGDPQRPGIVHRLDRGTSGVLAVARSQVAYEGLVEALSERAVTRQYVAVAWGILENDKGTIDAPIGRSARQRTRMAVTEAGKTAQTHYEVVDRRHDHPAMSVVNCQLETGRTHQIRVHLQAIGHSVVGDDTYGGLRSTIDFISEAPSYGRPALHARRLRFVHPVTEEVIDCEAELPADIATLIADHF